jgi:hypothetical protein
VKIPPWVPYTGHRTDAGGLLPQRQAEGFSATPVLLMLETGSSQIVTEARPQSRLWTPRPGVGGYSRLFCRLIVHVHTEIEGPTCKCTYTPACRHDHQCKQTPGWTLTPPPPEP